MMQNNSILKELPAGIYLQSGKYTVERTVGVGGFGITYYVRQNLSGQHFAVKEFFISGYCLRNTQNYTVIPQGMENAVYKKYLQKFIEEAQTLARLDHPNIVKVADIFMERNTAFMLMPFLEGQNLQQMVDQHGPLNYETTVNYIAQISEAVGYIHTRNILHRDIKPDNIIITPENKAILIDFGSAREFVQDKTQSHTSILTQGYAPLEQYSVNSRKGSYSDIYSMGAAFYFALTGIKPMDAASRTMETMSDPKTIRPSIPEEANRTIMKAMQIMPENRHQSIAEFMEDLGVVTKVKQPVNVAPPQYRKTVTENRPTVKKTEKGSSTLATIVSILVTVAIITVIWVVSNRKSEKQIRVEQFKKEIPVTDKTIVNNQENEDYKEAINKNTISGYELFLQKYSNSKNRNIIETKKDNLIREKAEKDHAENIQKQQEQEQKQEQQKRAEIENENTKRFNEARKNAKEYFNKSQKTEDIDIYYAALKDARNACNKALSLKPDNAEMKNLKQKIDSQLNSN
jgi:serine/threonine protein kinase